VWGGFRGWVGKGVEGWGVYAFEEVKGAEDVEGGEPVEDDLCCVRCFVMGGSGRRETCVADGKRAIGVEAVEFFWREVVELRCSDYCKSRESNDGSVSR